MRDEKDKRPRTMVDVSPRNKYVTFVQFILFVVIVAITSSCKGSSKSRQPFGGRLPPTVSDIREQDVDMFPDWEYYFRATMPSKDCATLLAKVSSDEFLHSVAEHQWLDGKGDWGPGNPPLWWKPTWEGGHQHGRSGDVNICAMCREGVFYYWSGSH